MDHLDDNAASEFVSGALSPSALARAERHLASCRECRALVAALAGDAGGDSAAVTLQRDAGSFGPLPRASLTCGDRVGRYLVLSRLGAGGMGVVFTAHDPQLGRKVALKLLRSGLAVSSQDARTRLRREAQAIAQLSHPNVVSIYDVGTTEDGALYIAMEFVEGDTLTSWLRMYPRDWREILDVFRQAARGLLAAHSVGLLHRDFKPDNVLVGGDGRVRVTDFGLARSVLAPDEISQAKPAATPLDVALTATGTVLGTPRYMPPEQLLGPTIDARADQFSFCVALYEALYGSRPFEGKTFDDLGRSVCEGVVRPPPPGSRVSGALHAIVLRGLEVRPGDRFPTMEHLLGELGRDRARPWRRTAIAATAVAAALGLGLVADLVVRDRVTAEIGESFALTGRQTNRAWDGLTARFDASANQVYSLSVMRDVSSNRDQAEFGLGDPQSDADNFDRIHSELASQDWTLVQDFAGTQYPTTIAVADKKGRMMYSSAAPGHARSDLTQLPWVKSALTQKDRTISLVRTDDPALVATGLLGPSPPRGLGLFYTRTLVLGTGKTKEVASAFIEEVDAARMFGEIRGQGRRRDRRHRRGLRRRRAVPRARPADPRLRQPGRRRRRHGAQARHCAPVAVPRRAPGLRARHGRRDRRRDRGGAVDPAHHAAGARVAPAVTSKGMSSRGRTLAPGRRTGPPRRAAFRRTCRPWRFRRPSFGPRRGGHRAFDHLFQAGQQQRFVRKRRELRESPTYPAQVDILVHEKQRRRVLDVHRPRRHRLEHHEVLCPGHRRHDGAELCVGACRDRIVFEGGPCQRNVEAHPCGLVPEQQDHAFAHEYLGVGNARNDALPGQQMEKRRHVDAVALNDSIDVRGHPANSACDDRDTPDHHPRYIRSLQGAHECCERSLDPQLTSSGLASHGVAPAPSGVSPAEHAFNADSNSATASTGRGPSAASRLR
ncbi:MAG: serine/threonine protein kinase [Deltaproteobacteria bacterium]|nr:MAG: serine/threonine protein kinase [Deltaproteobacteria bacterium]